MSNTEGKLCGTCKFWTGDGSDIHRQCGWAEPIPFWACIETRLNRSDWTLMTEGTQCAAWASSRAGDAP